MFTTTSRWAAAAATALVLATPVAATAAPAAGTAAPAGFRIVKETTGEALALTSPVAGELWVAERGENGTLVLEHRRKGRWSTTRLDVPAHGVSLASDGRRVALVSDGRLFLLTGHRWHEVAAPESGGYGPLTVSAVALDGGALYVGVTGRIEGGGAVYRREGRGWASLGGPFAGDDLAAPLDLRVVDGTLLARWRRGGGPTSVETVWRHTGGGWARQYEVAVSGPPSRNEVGAWVVREPGRQLVLGRTQDFSGSRALCVRYTEPRPAEPCTSSTPVGGADVRADGSIVVGDAGSGGFRIRYLSSAERPLPGDSGAGTVAVETEPGTNVSWALTRRGDGTLLQRNAG